ncbi:aspartate--tRNA ligase [Euzebya rosea]|uniref:aspartate--tRNA ligase n=1 Tax=Euzebya rosea TaxID=2052804 RepID=UPI000D3E9D95
MRSHGAGTIRASDDGQEVVLAGWVARRRDHGGVAFLDLRDRSGVCQVVADPTAGEALQAVHDVRNEYVVRVTGTVRVRPEGQANEKLDTGEVEVFASAVEVLSAADTPPFPIEDGIETDEGVRLTHRYVDLRRDELATRIRARAQVTSIMRRVMERHGFLDIETPILTRSTPEGARDFLVPSRLQPRSFYALPQSPQLFKQLLMVSGFERYYQIARCFRDEDLRADRQPEFTQLDVEASFVDEEDIYSVCEELMVELWHDVLGEELSVPFPRMPYEEAMRRFGSDKPDLRYAMELVDLDAVLADTGVGVFKGVLDGGGSVVGLCLPGGGELTRKEFDGWIDFAKKRGAKGLAWGVVEADGALRSPLSKFMTEDEIAGILEACGASEGDAIFFGAGETQFARELMGALRVALAHARGMVPEGEWRFVWVTDWPMFEWDEDAKRWDALHHPFTAPAAEAADSFADDPGPALARAYDLALNGTELGGGSMRIHDRAMQEKVFELLGISREDAEERFGFLLRGLSYGAPPHGGIAFGLDRIVMLMTGATSLRDVIPFPKTQSGGDPMTEAPAGIDTEQLTDLGLRILPPPVKG